MNYCCNAQSTHIVLRGSVFADSGNALNNCSIKVMQKGSPNTLYYTNTGEKNTFSVRVLAPETDSLFITFSHSGYSPVVKRFMPAQVPANMEIVLTISPQLLPEVSIGPSTWKTGDTTFFKVDSFKIGDERKLKDIIAKLPGFNISDEGILEYKRKAVSKITVNGEDLFSDKMSLLLNNFPAQVLNTIQALENQSDSKLLKGLVGAGKIVVNLGIKKEKLKTAFGDAEAGVGSSGNYFFNPVIFALYGKLKMGFIGNYNSTGNGVGYMQEAELKNSAIRLADNWMMMNSYLYSIPNFENRNYINNQQWDNRLKFNYSHTEKIKSEIELNYLKDNQRQAVNSRSVSFNDSNYIERFENISNRRKPDVLLAKEKTTWSISESKELVVELSTYLNHSSGLQQSVYTQNMKTDTTENSLQNRFKTFSGQILFTNRISKNTGYNFFVKYANIDNTQNSFALSAAWPDLYKLNNADYKNLNLSLYDRSENFETGIEVITKTKKEILSNRFTFQSFTSDIATAMLFCAENKSLADTSINSFNNKGWYKTNTFSGTTGKSFKFFRLPVSAVFQYGIAGTQIKEPSKAINFTTPVYNLKLSQKTKYGENFEANFNLSYSNTNSLQSQLSEILLQRSFNSFHRGNINRGALTSLSANYSLGFDLIKKSQFVFLNFIYTNNLSGYVSGNSYNQFVQLTVDTFVRKPRSVYGFSLNYSIPSLFKKYQFVLDGGFFYNDIIYKQSTDLLNGNLFYQHWHLTIKRNWDKKYFLTLDGDYTGFNNKHPDGFGKIKSSNNLSNLKIALKQKLFVSKRLNILLNAESYRNNFLNVTQSQLFFAETGCDFSFPKFPIMFSIKGANLLNVKTFSTVQITPLYQSFNAIPLIRRNLFISFRYEL